MDYLTYRKLCFVDPTPTPKYKFGGIHGAALYFEEYEKAVSFYTQVLGPPAYVEGESVKDWQLDNTWLSLFPAQKGAPYNTDVQIVVKSPAEADKLQLAFIDAGGEGPPPINEHMYQPIRMCPVSDPFGTSILILAYLP